MKTYVSFQFSKQEKLIVTFSNSHKKCRLSVAPRRVLLPVLCLLLSLKVNFSLYHLLLI